MNAVQFAGSAACGTCAEVWGNGKLCPHGIQGEDCGLGQPENAIKEKFLAVVTDELWERGHGDIDLGDFGDGKYPVEWRVIPCPWDKTSARIALHAGANRNYLKVQFRYLDSGMKWVQNEGTGEVSGNRFHDNHFVFENEGEGVGGWAGDKLRFRAESNMGTQYCGEIDARFLAAPFEYSAWPC